MRPRTIRKSFNITQQHEERLTHEAEARQISPSEVLRRILDAHWELPHLQVVRGITKGTKLKRKEWRREMIPASREAGRIGGRQ